MTGAAGKTAAALGNAAGTYAAAAVRRAALAADDVARLGAHAVPEDRVPALVDMLSRLSPEARHLDELAQYYALGTDEIERIQAQLARHAPAAVTSAAHSQPPAALATDRVAELAQMLSGMPPEARRLGDLAKYYALTPDELTRLDGLLTASRSSPEVVSWLGAPVAERAPDKVSELAAMLSGMPPEARQIDEVAKYYALTSDELARLQAALTP